MKKLKCTSCGGELEVEENKEYAKCKYCGTRYKLNEDLNINLKLDDNTKQVLTNGLEGFKQFTKPNGIEVVAILIIFASIFFIIMTFIPLGRNISNNYNEERETQEKTAEKNHFNIQFYGSNGTNNSFLVKHTLDEIIESNKTHDRKVTLVFNGTETTDESEIIEIKQSLEGEYEVSLNYDEEGFINKIKVEKID